MLTLVIVYLFNADTLAHAHTVMTWKIEKKQSNI